MSASPCATCPWLRKNQTPAARAASPRGDGERYRWYDIPNLKRLWKGYQTGHPTLCHATDSKAGEYGGKNTKEGHERACVGGLILVGRCVNVLNERASTMKPGRRKPWTGLFTRDGMLYWLDVLVFRGTPLGPKQEQFPTEFNADAAKEVRVPWNDDILNAGAV